MSGKRKVEKQVFEIFNTLYSKFPLSIIQHRDKPDIWIQSKPTTIGIEITEIFKDTNSNKSGSHLKRNESLQQTIARDVNKFIARVYPSSPLWIDINFKNDNTTDRRVKPLSEEIAQLILSHVHKIDFDKDFDHYTIQDWRIMPVEISDINIAQHRNHVSPHVFSSVGGWSPNMSKSYLTPIIDKKSELISTYKKFDEYWLLLGEGFSFASYFDQCKANILNGYTSGFSRIFLVRGFNKEVLELGQL